MPLQLAVGQLVNIHYAIHERYPFFIPSCGWAQQFTPKVKSNVFAAIIPYFILKTSEKDSDISAFMQKTLGGPKKVKNHNNLS